MSDYKVQDFIDCSDPTKPPPRTATKPRGRPKGSKSKKDPLTVQLPAHPVGKKTTSSNQKLKSKTKKNKTPPNQEVPEELRKLYAQIQ